MTFNRPHRISEFTARYDGECDADLAPDCDAYFSEGDDIGYVNNDIACGKCVEYAKGE